MSVSNNTLYAENEILMVTTVRGDVFAGEVVARWRGAVMFYDVRNSLTGKITVVTQNEVQPFRVIARCVETGRYYVVTLRFRLGENFIGDWRGQTVEVCKDCVVRVLMPRRAAA